jgi:hypothetical protein
MTFSIEQLANWEAYEAVRKSGVIKHVRREQRRNAGWTFKGRILFLFGELQRT